MIAADFNGDGVPDILAASFSNPNTYVTIFLGKGDGTFKYPPLSAWTGNGVVGFVNDYNGDGILDLSVLITPYTNQNQIGVFLGSGNGTFQQSAILNITPYSDLSFTAGDFNSDGNTDFIVSQEGYADQFSIFLGNGNGTFQTQEVVALPDDAWGINGMIPGRLQFGWPFGFPFHRCRVPRDRVLAAVVARALRM
jgi:hypothetical protein